MPRIPRLFALLCLLVPALVFSSPNTRPKSKAARRSITKIVKNVYRFQNNFHYSIFLVGKRHLFMTDPIDKEAAQWLKAAIEKKFGKRTIQYVFYSHNHRDHVSGGEVFDQGSTQFIAHEWAYKDLKRQQIPTRLPNIRFKKQLNVDFEGLEIQLIHFGRNNGRGNAILYIPSYKFVFGVDWVLIKRLPWKQLYYYDIDGMIQSLQALLRYDFKIVAPGHSVVGTKADLREFTQYLIDLRAAVLKAMNQGQSLAQMQKSIKLTRYRHFAKYNEWRKMNIKGVYQAMERASGRYGQTK